MAAQRACSLAKFDTYAVNRAETARGGANNYLLLAACKDSSKHKKLELLLDLCARSPGTGRADYAL